MQSQNTLRREMTENWNQFDAVNQTLRQQEEKLRTMLRRIDRNPLNMLNNAAGSPRRRNAPNVAARPRRLQGDDHVDPTAVLSPRITNLHVLWDEYQHGIGGNKPAYLFTSREKGRCRFKYCRRKIFWDLVRKMVDRGDTAQQAIDKIYAALGPSLCVTRIIQEIQKRRKSGDMPEQLRV